MNRWRHRLAELHCAESRAPALPAAVQNVQNVQNPAWSGPEEERAAIAEYEGGIPREWTEGLAGSILTGRQATSRRSAGNASSMISAASSTVLFAPSPSRLAGGSSISSAATATGLLLA
jgi:hypothetical protein